MARRKRTKVEDATSVKKKKARTQQSTASVVTRGAKKRAVTGAVFLTTELLESVLRLLPMKDLLLAQRVCRKWRVVIMSSTELQQALFQVPIKPEFYFKHELSTKTRKWELNRLRASGLAENTPLEKLWLSAELNPLLLKREHEPEYDLSQRVQWAAGETIEFGSRPSMRFPEASWRTMLLTQPPATTMDGDFYPQAIVAQPRPQPPMMHSDGRITDHLSLSIANMVRAEGVRAQDVFEVIEEAEEMIGPMDWNDQWMSPAMTLLPTDAELQDFELEAAERLAKTEDKE